MISLEQIKTLDEKVKQAVSVIDDLRAENSKLKQNLSNYQSRIEELERLIEDFKRDQGAIEKGIIDAIDQLDKLEHASPAENSVPAEQEAPSAREFPETSEEDRENSTAGQEDTPQNEADTADARGNGSADGDNSGSDSDEHSAETKPAFYSEEEPEDGETNELDIF